MIFFILSVIIMVVLWSHKIDAKRVRRERLRIAKEGLRTPMRPDMGEFYCQLCRTSWYMETKHFGNCPNCAPLIAEVESIPWTT